MGFPSTALGIETGASELRVVQLSAQDQRAIVTGYASVARPTDDNQLGKSVGQLIAALNTEAEIPINLVDSAHTGERALNDVLARLAELGLNDVDFEPVERAKERAVGRNDIHELTGFIDCPIPSGLLAAHDRLAIADLAPAVGAALARLGLGFSAERAADDHIAVWTADTDPGAALASNEGIDADETDLSDVTVANVAGMPATEAIQQAEIAPTDMPDIVLAAPSPADRSAGHNEADELAAHDSISDVAPAPQHDDETATAVRPLAMLLGLVAVIGFGLLAYVFFGGADTEAAAPAGNDPDIATQTEADQPQADQTQADGTGATITAAEPTPTALPAPTATPAPADTTASVPAAAPTEAPAVEAEADVDTDPANVVPLSELPQRGAIYRASEGLLYLQGPVTADEAEALEARAIEVLGADRVVNEYVIRPDAPPVTEGNVRVEQAVLFETGSAVIAQAFLPTLELGVLVMNLNPQVSMVVEGHTDDVGSDAINQSLSDQRAQAVVEYLVGRGVDRDRLIPVGFGETEPVADNATETGRQLNRRIEVDLVDLLSPRPADS